MFLILLLLCTGHYIIGAIIFMATDVSPNFQNIKIWKVLVIGGLGMMIHYGVNIASEKLSVAKFNWSLKEWIRK